ncbi:karyopherin/importin beta family nuclear import signal receptor Kap111 [Schizosaccharomyces osmophilus]|uniref:Karyopherin/importin beta family nuclear import signal receptor Kap111 n=1 Tax=Schizosaccharomyces osmophilus TaxID=2545709 RepID=A0AAF0AUJ0_9SCHI|nr:karyopherin/importin beta family nuclear import signal receptor Kap111 [Schizosaccharomyces osmophilus]WBW70909.1 karyopherin/importin beta family nuclear import signal receptor Kap111 [Schizosaccharomyces osmophilus]
MEGDELAYANELVHNLYSGTLDPASITVVEKDLQRIQKSESGWAIGLSMLQSSDVYQQFFGALTLQMKINTQWESLDGISRTQLSHRLLEKLLNKEQLTSLVERKVICTLAALSIKCELNEQAHFTFWIIYSLYYNDYNVLTDLSSLSDVLPPLPATAYSSQNAYLATLFLNELFLELSSSIYTKENEDLIFKRFFNSCSDFIIIILTSVFQTCPFQLSEKSSVQALEQALNCVISLSAYLQKNSVSLIIGLPQLAECIDSTVNCLALDPVSEKAMNTLSDLLASYSHLVSQNTIQKLWDILVGEWGETRLKQELDQADSEEENDFSFLNLIIGFSESMLNYIIENIQEEKCIKILYILVSLLGFPGYAIAEEEVSWRTLEFWTTFIEDFAMSDSFSDPIRSNAFQGLAFSAIDRVYYKMLLPSSTQWEEWPSNIRDAFHSYRRDLGDLLESSYSIIGEKMLTMYVSNIESLLQDDIEDWRPLEASFYCLTCILDNETSENEYLNSWLIRLFNTNFPVKAAGFGNPLLLKTTSQILSDASSFLQKNPQYLNISLPVLFDALNIPDSSLQISASRSIHSLCTTCAVHLVSEVEAFVCLVENLTQSLVEYPFVLERIYSSVGFVINSLYSLDSQTLYLTRLLSCLASPLQPNNYPDLDTFENVIKACLQSLVGLAISQSPSNNKSVVDIEKVEENGLFWSKPQIISFQEKVMSFLSYTESSALQYADVVGLICKIIIAGLNELEPSPFSLHISATVQYFCTRFTEFPASILLTLASAILTSPYGRNFMTEDLLQSMIMAIRSRVMLNDEEFFENNIDITIELYHFSTIFYQKHPSFLEIRYLEFLQFLLEKAIYTLCKPERLLESASGQFLSAFISIELNSESNEVHKTLLDSIRMPLITKILLGFGGGASRSSLPLLSDILGKLKTQNFGATKTILTQLLSCEGFPSSKANNEVKHRFLQDLLKVRIKDKVKEFWIITKGFESTPYGNSSWTF